MAFLLSGFAAQGYVEAWTENKLRPLP